MAQSATWVNNLIIYYYTDLLMCLWGREIWGVGGWLQDACVRTGCRALPKEWVMEETFKTKLLQASRTRPAQKCKEQIQDYVSLLTFPSYFFSMDFTRSIKQQRLFESLRELLLANQLCVSCMHGACQRRSRVEVWRCLLKSKYPWLEILALTARCGL